MTSGFDLLARTFLRRFFDNEITGGSGDLRSSFFWMLAFLAVPGLVMPVLMSFNWTGYAIVYGPDGLRIASRADKVFYLGYALVATGVLTSVTWSSLLLDRLDCLVLGILPVSGTRIVRAKLLALFAYVLIVTAGMHALASASYGFFLAERSTLTFAWRGMVAHLVASCAMSAFVLLLITAGQGLVLLVVGARRFTAISPWMQSLVTALVILFLLVLPAVSAATVDTLTSTSPVALARSRILHVEPWILNTPPLWFLGLYETVLGTRDPQLLRLGMIALANFAAAALLTVVTYPLAYRRLVSSVMQAPAPAAGHNPFMQVVDWTVSHVSRAPATIASAQSLTLAVRRSMPHRLALALALGLTLAIVSPTLFWWAPRLSDLPSTPPVELLSLPLRLILGTLVGLRLAAALPSDLPSSWVLNSVGVSSVRARSGVWRTMFLGAVVLVACSMPLYWYVWGRSLALRHAGICLLVAAALIEGLLWHFEGMPCSRPWRPEHANLRKWWPAYLALFLLITRGLPELELLAFRATDSIIGFAVGIAAIGVMLRVFHNRRRMIPAEDFEEPVQVQVLNLD